MNTEIFFKNNYLINLINENNNIKQENIKVINSFKKLYEIIKLYYSTDKSYDEIIENSDSRVEFLINSITVALTSKTMDKETKNLVFQMYSSLYQYLTSESKLKEITIPNEVKEKIFKKNFMPSSEQILFLMTLIAQNKKIYDEEFDGKDFSQTFEDGLHKNITEVLSIEKEKLSHLLGMTSQGNSLYEFYRKITIRKTIKQKLGKDLNVDNYSKLINWRFKDPNSNKLTEEEVILNNSCELMPKSKTIDFYLNSENIIELIKENKEVCDFTYEYIRKEMFIKKYENKGERKEILNKFTEEEITLIRNTNSNNKKVRELLDRYIENRELTEISDFQNKFKKRFGYSYPLIEYNKLLSKNISFYNFSLFENLNSIIVDYSPQGKINSDLFLVSYSQAEMKKQNEFSKKIIKEEIEKYEKISIQSSNSNEIDIDKEYLKLVKSLMAFPPDERYYFRQMNDRLEEKHNVQLLDKNINKIENISLIGFASSPKEKERIQGITDIELQGFEHYHYCETNESTNYFDYQTKWVKNGVEYPISVIIEPQSKKILKLSRYIDDLRYSIQQFNEYKYNKSMDIRYSITYEKYLIKEIIRKLDNYENLKRLNISIKELKIETNTYDYLVKEKKNLEKINSYNQQIKDYLNNYLDILDKNLIGNREDDLISDSMEDDRKIQITHKH